MNTISYPLLETTGHCWAWFERGRQLVPSLSVTSTVVLPSCRAPQGSVWSTGTEVKPLWRWFGTLAICNIYLSIKTFLIWYFKEGLMYFMVKWLFLKDSQDTKHIKDSEKPYSVFLKLN